VLVLASLRKPALVERPHDALMRLRDGIGAYARLHAPELPAAIERAHDLTPEVERGIDGVLARFLDHGELPSDAAAARAQAES
jgi:hypothetical protein